MAKDASHSLLGPRLRRAETVTKKGSTLPGEGRASLDSEADQGASELSQPHPAWGSSRLSSLRIPCGGETWPPPSSPNSIQQKGICAENQEWDIAVPIPALWDRGRVKVTFFWPQFSHLWNVYSSAHHLQGCEYQMGSSVCRYFLQQKVLCQQVILLLLGSYIQALSNFFWSQALF